jgi:hypothetical protein
MLIMVFFDKLPYDSIVKQRSVEFLDGRSTDTRIAEQKFSSDIRYITIITSTVIL